MNGMGRRSEGGGRLPASENDLAMLVRQARAFDECARLHAAATATFEGPVAHGATNLAVAAALALAATPTATEALHAAKMSRVADWVGRLPPALRRHVLPLVDAAMVVDAARHGAPPPDGMLRIPRSAFPDVGAALHGPADHTRHDAVRPGAIVACIEAATDDDLDLVQADIDVIVDGIPFLPRADRESCLAAFEEAAMTLCVRPAASQAEGHALRPVLVRLWRVLRRRRPDAAAVLRRKLLADLDRAGVAGRTAGRRVGAPSLAAASP